MNSTNLVLIFIFLCVLSGCNEPKSNSGIKERSENVVLDSAIVPILKKYDIPAIVCARFTSDSVLAIGVEGIRKISDPSDSVTVNDNFFLASNTKSMTATMIANLVDQGMLKWSTTTAEVWPDRIDSIHEVFRGVTIKQLLSHSAGIQPMTSYEEWEDLPPLKRDSAKSFVEYLLKQEPVVNPGSKFVYSNGGYAVAARMASQVTGKDWESLIKEFLLEPLEITCTFGRPGQEGESQPWGHWNKTREDSLEIFDPIGNYIHNATSAAAGAVSMDLKNYIKYVQVHLRALRGEHVDFLDHAAFETLHAPVIAMTDSTFLPAYALGWVIAEIDGVRSSGHSGSGGLFKAKMLIQPEENLGIVILMNAGNDKAEEAADELMEYLLNLNIRS